MKQPLVRSIAVLGLATACVMATAPSSATAPDPRGEPSIHVDTHNIDLARPDAVTRLYTHLQSSARKVCRDVSSSSDSGALRAFDQCYTAALDKAVQSVRAPLLSALHQEQTRSRFLGQAKN